MEMLFYAHSGLRYLVLLLGLVALVYFGYATATKNGNERTARILGASFTGALDLQALLGILMVAFGLFYSALIGHLVMMLGAVAVAHTSMALAKSSANAERAHAIRLMGVIFTLVLIAGAIMAIGRSIFGSGSPTMI